MTLNIIFSLLYTKAVSGNVAAIQDVRYSVDENISEIKAKADQQQQVIKRLENTLVLFQSIITSQSKEIDELRSKLERIESDEDDEWSRGLWYNLMCIFPYFLL